MSNNQLLFLGHIGHKKTKSSDFMQEIFRKKYEVTTIYLDPSNPNIAEVWQPHAGKNYDVLVVWQLMPNLSQISQYLSWKKGIYFPMYDNVVIADGLSKKIWKEYAKMTIVCFSKKLHEDLLAWGFDSKYIQYFPQPKKINNWGQEDAIFFWQRQTDLSLGTLAEATKDLPITKIHFHRAIDPTHKITQLEKFGIGCEKYFENKEYSESTWFEDKSEMEDVLTECALYMAPRHLEGIGMSFLEAMAMGRCVIAPNLSTMNEYIKHGETGLLYDWDDSLTHCVSSVTLNDVRIRHIQENTYKFISEGYEQWEKEKNILLQWAVEPTIINDSLLAQCDKHYGWSENGLNNIIKKKSTLKNVVFFIVPVILLIIIFIICLSL